MLAQSHHLYLREDMNCTWEEAMNNDVYYEPHTCDTKGQSFIWIWTSYIDGRIVGDSTLTPDYVVYAINLFHYPPLLAFKFLYDKGFDWYHEVNLHDCSQWDKMVWLDKIMYITKSIQECRRFYTLTLHENNRREFYYTIIDAMARYNIRVNLDISKDVITDYKPVNRLIRAWDAPTLMQYCKSLILSDPRYVYEVVKTKKYTCEDFYSVVPKICIMITLKRPKEEITKELYDAWFSAIGVDHPSFLYIHTYLEAPPKWMCLGCIRSELKRACIREGIIPPTYLDPDYCVDVKHCTHDAETYYTDELESEVVCDKCANENPEKTYTKVYNLRCPICFEDVPEKVHIFDCGHTICKECYPSYKKCPFCSRT